MYVLDGYLQIINDSGDDPTRERVIILLSLCFSFKILHDLPGVIFDLLSFELETVEVFGRPLALLEWRYD